MFVQLFSVALAILAQAPLGERRVFTVWDAASVADDVELAIPDPVWPGEQALAVEQSWEEARWRTSPPGHNDAGAACGATQINRWVLPAGFTCEQLRRDRVAAFRAWHVLVSRAVARCGGVRSGLGAVFASGKCGSVPMMVARRCARAGGAC